MWPSLKHSDKDTKYAKHTVIGVCMGKYNKISQENMTNVALYLLGGRGRTVLPTAGFLIQERCCDARMCHDRPRWCCRCCCRCSDFAIHFFSSAGLLNEIGIRSRQRGSRQAREHLNSSAFHSQILCRPRERTILLFWSQECKMHQHKLN